MIELKGRYNTAKVFADEIEPSAAEQIENLLNQEFISGSRVRVMPDVHAGMGCTIGTTMTVTDKIVPNLVGVDIGCGMLTVPLGKIEIDFAKFDRQVQRGVPSGAGEYHNSAKYAFAEVNELKCFKYIKTSNVDRMAGTLGGGNHFIELDADVAGDIYFVVHTGSRNLGKQVCDYYQDLAVKNYRNGFAETRAVVDRCKAENRSRDIEKELRAWHRDKDVVPPSLCYLTGGDKDDYLRDMAVCQRFASFNRWAIADELLKNYFYPMDVRFSSSYKLKIKEKEFKLSSEGFETVHNYIDLEHGIIRKGAISAQAGELVLIPVNMRDGAIIARGKGIADMNYSLPHGAGRLMSRTAAEQNINVEEFRKSMEGVYSSVVGEGTLDEAPQTYRDTDTIMNALDGLLDDAIVVKPVYNFKAVENKNRRWK